MATSFQSRRLRFTIQLATGSFNKNGNPDEVILDAFRSSAEIDYPGGEQYANARVRIKGISQETMNRLTIINYSFNEMDRNLITIEASDDNGDYCVIFHGTIFEAMADYLGAPDVSFNISAQSGLLYAIKPSGAISFPGAFKVADIVQIIAKEMGLKLENNGVTAIVTDQSLAGSAVDKLNALVNATRIQMWILEDEGVIAIAPAGSGRTGSQVLYNPSTGLVGWPTKISYGIQFTGLFNPAVKNGTPIKMESQVEPCNGGWFINSLSHRLDCDTPGGAWFTHFIAAEENFVATKQ